jgi:Rho-associated protein kinase 1
LSELESAKQRELHLQEDCQSLVEKVAALEKECASLELELKAAQNRYQQEVRSHEETERTRLVNKEEANLEVVKGLF